jgi:hypothetical protein
VLWFKVYGQKWFSGSTRFELEPDERGCWIDILAKASINDPPGEFEYFNLEQLAHQFNVKLDLLIRTLDKSEKFGKIRHLRKKRKIIVLNWKKYQSEYERQRPYRQQLTDVKKTDKSCNQITTGLHVEERRGEEKREEREREKIKKYKKKKENEGTSPDPLTSPLPSSPKEGKTVKEEFFELLRGCKGYPFDEAKDSLIFEVIVQDSPHIDIPKQTQRKISWWRDNPGALKADPRRQLQDFCAKEEKFKARGGPQRTGNILKKGDVDRTNFIKKTLEQLKPKTLATSRPIDLEIVTPTAVKSETRSPLLKDGYGEEAFRKLEAGFDPTEEETEPGANEDSEDV